jgi:hypothetical protein
VTGRLTRAGVRQKGDLPGPPPVVPHPESLAAQTAYPFGHSDIDQVNLSPNCFQALGSFPGPAKLATGSHIVIRGTPVAQMGQLQLNVPEKKNHRGPRGKPLQTRFPKEPHHRRAADDSLADSHGNN